MLQQHKKDMLDAMGLKLLQPRFQLSGAKPSPIYIVEPGTDIAGEASVEAPAETFAEQTPEQKVEAKTSPIAELSNLQSAEPRVSLELEDSPKTVAASVLKPLAAEQYKSLKFRYRLVQVGELLMLLEQPHLEWQQQREAQLFFADVYFALSQKRFEYWNEIQFDWPPSKQFALADDLAVARETFISFVREQAQAGQARYVLIWGEKGVQHLFADELAIGDIREQENLPFLVLHDLHYYWQHPHSKKLLWQYLQGVRKTVFP